MSRRLTNEERLDRAVTEKVFQDQLIQLAHLYKWRVAHFRASMDSHGRWKTAVAADGVGFPDLLCVRGAAVVAIEVKGELGKTTPEQEQWLDALRLAGVMALVMRPSDLRKGIPQRLFGHHPADQGSSLVYNGALS